MGCLQRADYTLIPKRADFKGEGSEIEDKGSPQREELKGEK
jgi:hypothetical protein